MPSILHFFYGSGYAYTYICFGYIITEEPDFLILLHVLHFQISPASLGL